jgi:dihydroneopterin aldolase
MSLDEPKLDGLVPDHLRVRSSRVLLDSLEVQTDIGFHDFEVGQPQRLLVTVEIWLEDVAPPDDDDPSAAWDYDYLRTEVQALASARRYNLQETLAHAIYQRVAAMRGVKAVRVATAKPDIYPEARGVGVEVASFE